MKKDGGPAFPCDKADYECGSVSAGMSLRDHFAIAALQGLLAATPPKNWDEKSAERVVFTAFKFSDIMIAEREK